LTEIFFGVLLYYILFIKYTLLLLLYDQTENNVIYFVKLMLFNWSFTPSSESIINTMYIQCNRHNVKLSFTFHPVCDIDQYLTNIQLDLRTLSNSELLVNGYCYTNKLKKQLTLSYYDLNMLCLFK